MTPSCPAHPGQAPREPHGPCTNEGREAGGPWKCLQDPSSDLAGRALGKSVDANGVAWGKWGGGSAARSGQRRGGGGSSLERLMAQSRRLSLGDSGGKAPPDAAAACIWGGGGFDHSAASAGWSPTIFLHLITGALHCQCVRQAWHSPFDLIKPF